MNYGDYGNSYSTTSYGAGGGGGGGGGFFEGSQGGSQGSPGGGRDKKNTLRPVTIKQALEAQSADNEFFKIDDHDVNHVSLVAQIRNISDQAAYTTYKVDDGTGSLDIKQWLDPDLANPEDEQDTSDLPPHIQPNKTKLTENMYVRILGQLKMFKNKRMVAAHSLRPIKEFNEVLYHLLECTAVHLYFTRGPPEQFHIGDGDVVMGGMPKNIGTNHPDTKGASGNSNYSAQMTRTDLSVTANRILSLLRKAPGDEGLHVTYIQQQLGIALKDVEAARKEMLACGAVYSTLSDDYIAAL